MERPLKDCQSHVAHSSRKLLDRVMTQGTIGLLRDNYNSAK